MGFGMEVTVLRPETWVLTDAELNPRGKTMVWWPEVILVGYASWPGNGRELPKGHALADLCTFSWLFAKLLDHTKKVERKLFAPPFAPLEEMRLFPKWDGHISPYRWELENSRTREPGGHLMMPWWSDELQFGLPREEERRKHNDVVSLSKRKFARWVAQTKYDPMYVRPFSWVHCQMVASWLRELERGDVHYAQQVLKRDRKARSIVAARRGYFAGVSRAGYRALFTFERSAFGSLATASASL